MAYYVYSVIDSYSSIKGGYVRLHVIKTSPNNIKLTPISGTVPASGLVGVNAGFFDDKTQTVQSICIQNSTTVQPGGSSVFACGYYNNDSTGHHVNKGTLVWDADWRTYRQQIIQSAAELTIGNPDRYWAQGGLSMHLQSDSAWNTMRSNNQELVNDQFPTSAIPRTALLYGNSLNVYLVITTQNVTMDVFREACKGIDSSNGLQGIFLDGSTATQMNVPNQFSFSGGSNRKLPAMIEVVNNVQL
ncbi:hypothetical protein ACFFK0_23860 [Paenibacillus chartarius]|uniref:Phosphodiester glycosidase domain-containing protein n=1 Tax=Paenibacillus chartarius TaxID=747481 RepID=A0ABV6DS92_9BACL